MNIEVVKQKRHELGRYDMGFNEVIELITEAKKGGVDAMYDLAALSYAYGFIRGGNAERNKRNKQIKRINTKECEEAING